MVRPHAAAGERVVAVNGIGAGAGDAKVAARGIGDSGAHEGHDVQQERRVGGSGVAVPSRYHGSSEEWRPRVTRHAYHEGWRKRIGQPWA